MSNTVEICNIALMRVGANLIDDINEDSRPAKACKLFFPFSRDSVLRDHDWGFARKTVTLSELSEETLGYDYVYLYPADCLEVREIYNASKSYKGDKIPLAIGSDSTGNNKTILTNVDQAQIIYTVRITNSNLFDSMFADALAWRLAADLAEPLRTDAKKGERFMGIYRQIISAAGTRDGNEDFEAPETTSDIEQSRQ